MFQVAAGAQRRPAVRVKAFIIKVEGMHLTERHCCNFRKNTALERMRVRSNA